MNSAKVNNSIFKDLNDSEENETSNMNSKEW
jgi:hypothetical protein